MRVLVDGDKVFELTDTREWHYRFDWRDLRLGASFCDAMWEFNLPGLSVWCDRYSERGRSLSSVPEGAEVRVYRSSPAVSVDVVRPA